MRINVASVLVDDQDKALRFYTGVLGFVRKTEIPLGEARWLTVGCRPKSPSARSSFLSDDGARSLQSEPADGDGSSEH
jgi:catechol 2,3-dioxygenase-like lactoylglutathione lyase family enzyme